MFSVSFTSCYHCKNLDYCPMPEATEKYFSVFNEDNYWIYYNKDLTKKDSVYISNYEITREKDGMEFCIEWDNLRFHLNSSFMYDGDYLIGTFTGNTMGNGGVFRIKNYTEGVIVEINSANDVDTLLNQEILSGFWNYDSTFEYSKTIKYNDKYWFTPNIGIVQYVSKNSLDTFYLHEYYIH